jgi:hypothetical protein
LLSLAFSLDIGQAKAGFFDRDRVGRSITAANKKALSKFGAYVRTRARTSIRKRKAISSPGNPPSSHMGLLRKFLFFSYDASKQSVVIGPARLGGTKSPESLAALEYGGYSNVWGGGKEQRRYIRPRPFMGSAFELEKKALLPGLWKNSVR